MPDRVLVLAPHPDDETIGCGGVLCWHRQRQHEVAVVFLTSGERGLHGKSTEEVWEIREAEARAAGAVLDIAKLQFWRLPDQGLPQNVARAAARLRELLSDWPARLIYAPHPAEAHPDHVVTQQIVHAALPLRSPSLELSLYEVWTPLTNPGRTVDISAYMATKQRALRCYRSQLELVRYDRAVRGLDRYRGIMQGGCRYAEAFQGPGAGMQDDLPPEEVAG